MILGIVGHADEKFTGRTERMARAVIQEAVRRYRPEEIHSGRSPMGGVDVWAEEYAEEARILFVGHVPRVPTWEGDRGPTSGLTVVGPWSMELEYAGFKKRNLGIAHVCNLVLVIVVQDLPPGFRGHRFGPCYHCRGRNPEHVKSGACWTAWKAPAAEWVILK